LEPARTAVPDVKCADNFDGEEREDQNESYVRGGLRPVFEVVVVVEDTGAGAVRDA